jgi:hypothetical protein
VSGRSVVRGPSNVPLSVLRQSTEDGKRLYITCTSSEAPRRMLRCVCVREQRWGGRDGGKGELKRIKEEGE